MIDAPIRRFWIVSPNISNSAALWKKASIEVESAFMGYRPDDKGHKQIGYKFAQDVSPNDIILIARRHHKRPELVGMGVVFGKFRTKLKGFNKPTNFGSLRRLSPFKRLTAGPPGILRVLNQTAALRELHPGKYPDHNLICEWLEKKLGQKGGAHRVGKQGMMSVQLAELPHDEGLDYPVTTQRKIKLAKKRETVLVGKYREWLAAKGRELHIAKYKRLRCDAYEEKPRNLIEAKCSNGREYGRRAVARLFVSWKNDLWQTEHGHSVTR